MEFLSKNGRRCSRFAQKQVSLSNSTEGAIIPRRNMSSGGNMSEVEEKAHADGIYLFFAFYSFIYKFSYLTFLQLKALNFGLLLAIQVL
jgi:hypothetical protein